MNSRFISAKNTCGVYGGGERCAQDFGEEAGGKLAIGETKT
jgi:hypothetical protein